MTTSATDQVARALLYEGYLLYPYRRSAVKNRQRFNFGVVFPREHRETTRGIEPWEMRTEVLILGGPDIALEATVRFLHLFTQHSDPGEPAWQGAVEREVTARVASLNELVAAPYRQPFAFPGGNVPGRQIPVEGRLTLSAEQLAETVFQLSAEITNLTPIEPRRSGEEDRDEIMLHALVSTHTILRSIGGEFVSLTDPPAALQEMAAACRNIGTWPVLAGEAGARDTILSSPIIVYDFPSIAPESPGDFFDGTEMDEMLTLRILTLSDAEKREMAAGDERARLLLQRTEASNAETLMRMHGVLRDVRPLSEAP